MHNNIIMKAVNQYKQLITHLPSGKTGLLGFIDRENSREEGDET